MTSTSEISTVADALKLRADQVGERIAYSFLRDPFNSALTLTYATLSHRAHAIASFIAERTQPGDRALLLASGPDFVTSFFGCIIAGVVAVPVAPGSRARRSGRIRWITEHSEPAIVLATEEAFMASVDDEMQLPPTYMVGEIGEVETRPFTSISPSSTAFLQFSSGSTGMPRGVAISHTNLLHNLASICTVFDLSEDDISFSWLPMSHDMGLVNGVLAPLFAGCPALLMEPAAFVQRPANWLEAVSRHRVTYSGGPNFGYALCADLVSDEQAATLDLSCWTRAINGAEPVRPATLERFERRFAPQGFKRMAFRAAYGLAEATLMVTGDHEPPKVLYVDKDELEHRRVRVISDGNGTALAGCGRAVPGMEIVIVDATETRLCEPDETGEIWLSGESISAGYWRDFEATEARLKAFLPGSRKTYLRTGDIGFFSGGQLFVTGRIDDMLCIHGRNIAPQELEWTVQDINAALGVCACAAFTVEEPERVKLVLAIELTRSLLREGDFFKMAGAIQEATSSEHDLSADVILFLAPGKIPKTTSGKVRRKACRSDWLSGRLKPVHQSIRGYGAANASKVPGTLLFSAAEQGKKEPDIVADLRKQIGEAIGADVATIPVDCPLARLGVDSLQAIQIAHRIEMRFGVRLAMDELMRFRGIVEISQRLAHSQDQLKLPRSSNSPSTSFSGGKLATLGQRALLYHQQRDHENPADNVAAAFEISPPVDVGRLVSAWRQLINRHSGLNTVFTPTGQRLQRPQQHKPGCIVTHQAHDWQLDRLRSETFRLAHQSFKMTEGPLFQVHLFDRRSDGCLMVVCAHHAVIDMWSMAILLSELGDTYDGRKSIADILPVLVDPAADQYRWMASDAAEKCISYWRTRLEGAPDSPELSFLKPRERARSRSGARLRNNIAVNLAKQLGGVARAHNSGLFTLLLTIFQVLLSRLSGMSDIVVGTSVSGRTRPEWQNLVDYLINQIPLRLSVSQTGTFVEHLERTRTALLDDLANSDLPFAALVDHVKSSRREFQSPIFQVMFVMERSHLDPNLGPLIAGVPGAAATVGELFLRAFDIDRSTSQFDLTLFVIEGAGGTLDLVWEYDTALYDAATVERFSRHFVRLAEAVVEAPDLPVDKLAILSDAELAELDAWNATAIAPRQPECVHRWFETQVKAAPNAIAVSDAHESLTYDALNRRANQLAKHLLSRGVGNEERIAILLDRCCDLVVAILAVLKAGGAYLPLNPSHPRERLIAQVRDADATLVLSHSHLATLEVETLLVDDGVILAEDDSNLDTHPEPDALAYVIYTSGSSGVPKGVMISHRALANYLSWAVIAYPEAALGVTPLFSSIAFDATITPLFVPLLVGGHVMLIEQGGEIEVLERALCGREPLGCVKITPSHLDVLRHRLFSRKDFVPPLLLVVGGEALHADIAGAWQRLAPRTRIVNEYGPTETVVGCCVHVLDTLSGAKDPIPIGFPIANMRMHLLSAGGQEVPVGVVGEIHIGGPGLGRGYIGRPDLTAERFIEDPRNPTNRLYRTGDLGRRRMDGSIDYLGRIDDQIKVRGFRVEPAEIEAVLGRYPDVLAAAVVPDTSAATVRLDAFVVARRPLSIESLRQFLMEYLPNFMIPEAFFQLPALPLTTNGKLDKKALAQMRRKSIEAPEQLMVVGGESLMTGEMEVICGVWKELLNVHSVSPDETFFEIGGNSLLLARAAQLIEQRLQRRIEISEMLRFPTARKLAAYLVSSELVEDPLLEALARAKRQKETRNRRVPPD